MKHFHFIGICGVAMSAIALAFKRQGHKVTGSDVGFYPPISTYLKEAGVEFYAGWHPEKMGRPDMVIVGNVAGSGNPEWNYVQKQKIPYASYPEIVREYIIKKNSIVAAGTYGKTTSAALVSWILSEVQMQPSYMFGGLVVDKEKGAGRKFPSAEITSSDWSVVEGDEYKTSRWDMNPKFAYYSPTHALLTSVVWDHADVYPTASEYQQAFQGLVDMLPKGGLLVLSEKARPFVTIKKNKRLRVITYGAGHQNNYIYQNILPSAQGISFDILCKNEIHRINSTLLGEYMADNITGCFALADTIGVPPEKIIDALGSFTGIKRRLEKRLTEPIAIFDDIAHSPSKAQAVLHSLKKIYPAAKIIAVFEPNTGNRRHALAESYDRAFEFADKIIIPKLTHLKKDPSQEDEYCAGDDLAKIISKTHSAVRYIPNDEELLNYLTSTARVGDVVVFLGSHGFRGMIEELVEKIRNPND